MVGGIIINMQQEGWADDTGNTTQPYRIYTPASGGHVHQIHAQIIPNSLSSSAQGEGKWLGTEKKGRKRGNNHAM